MLFDFSYDAGEICCDGRMQNDRKRQKRARLRTSKIALQNSRRATSKRADETQNVFRSRNKIRCKNRENDVRNSLKLSHFAENGYHGWCGDNVRVLSSDSKLFLHSTTILFDFRRRQNMFQISRMISRINYNTAQTWPVHGRY